MSTILTEEDLEAAELMDGEKMTNYIPPQRDVMFKKVLGNKKSTKFTVDIINQVTKIPKRDLKNLTVDDPQFNPNRIGGKKTIVDVKIGTEKDDVILFEMQRLSHKALAERVIFSNDMAYVEGLSQGNDYTKLPKIISILFCDFPFFEDAINSYHDIHYIKSAKYDRILSKNKEFHIIELPKIPKGVYAGYDFLKSKNLEEAEMAAENNEAVSEALDVVKVFSADKDVREQARREMLAEMDFNQSMYESKEEGREEGIEKRNVEIVTKMLESRMDFETISNLTELTEQEILEISKL